MLRVVVDTNVIVSALFFGGKPGLVYEAGTDKKYLFVTPEELIKELLKEAPQCLTLAVSKASIS